MKRRKTSRGRKPSNYAVTYTESTSVLKIPLSTAGNALGVFTLTSGTGGVGADVSTLLGMTTAEFTAKYSGYKLNAVTFSLKVAASRSRLDFSSGQTHVITDDLKAARVKPSKFSPEGFWQQAQNSGVNPPALVGFAWVAAEVRIEYIELCLRTAPV
jgi:hypothetical protein